MKIPKISHMCTKFKYHWLIQGNMCKVADLKGEANINDVIILRHGIHFTHCMQFSKILQVIIAHNE